MRAGEARSLESLSFLLLTGFGVDLSEAVVAHLVHEAVEQHGGALAVHPELAGGRVVVVLLDVLSRVRAASDSHHPQELVDVWRGTQMVKW